jgi:DNA modification methylase
MDDVRNTAKKAARSGEVPNTQRRPTRAELIWDGKYDAAGRRVAPLRVALPFQTVETVNESARDRQRSLLLAPGFGEEEWRNRLIWGDKKYVLPSLLPEFAGKINLIYIDPPFDTGADFSFTATIPEAPESLGESSLTFTKEPSIIEQKAYRDTWGRGLNSYLQWFYETVIILNELLDEDGSLYVHLDWHVAAEVWSVLNEVFGSENFHNDIIWGYHRFGVGGQKQFTRAHDIILWFSKSTKWIFNLDDVRIPYSEKTKANFVGGIGGSGFGAGKLNEKGKIPEDHWIIAPAYKSLNEVLPYPTQKPEALLDRILRASSNEGDLILDCFVGSGTTAAVAEKLGRRWIACDLGRFAIHTTRKRLLSIPGVRPFMVQNLGKYERQLWAGAEFGENKAAVRQGAYIEFILKLAHAAPIRGYTWLHGLKAGRMVHVGAVDAPVTVSDVTQIAAEFRRAIGKGKDAPTTNAVDVLGWDFAFELNEVAKQQAAAANIQMRFHRIPRDVMDKRAVEQGDIRFFELAALSVDVKTNKRNVFLKLTDFVIPPDDVPEEARKAVKHWSQWIDYWAVDWGNKGDTFHNEWQTYRTRKDKSLLLETAHSYVDPGQYTVVVKVIDILGNDTTKTVKVTVL